MSTKPATNFESLLSAIPELDTEHWGFRLGDKGTHTSRTIMLDELEHLLSAAPGDVDRAAYVAATIDDNCLSKRTAATRKLSLQRLSELYGLDPSVPVFRVLRDLWPHHTSSRPLLAMLVALARDPLLRFTAPTVLNTPMGEELSRQRLKDSLSTALSHRLNAAILDKVCRNASSSWTQSGHLEGRVRKIRRRVEATPAACTFALLLGYMLGRRGHALFETPWTTVLDAQPHELIDLATDAKRLGLLDLKQSGSMIDVSFPQWLGRSREGLSYGTYR